MRRFWGVVFVFACIVFSAGIARPQEFSAAIVSTANGSPVSGTVRVSKDKLRLDMPPAVTILRNDKKVAWMLMAEQKVYVEMPIDARSLATSMEHVPGEISRTLLGTEAIGGRDTEKYEVTYRDHEQSETLYIWLSKELHFPLKSSARDGSWTVEYTNVSDGPQPPEMFEVPDGYTKYDYGETPAEAAGN
jgi:hypothetical protein